VGNHLDAIRTALGTLYNKTTGQEVREMADLPGMHIHLPVYAVYKVRMLVSTARLLQSVESALFCRACQRFPFGAAAAVGMIAIMLGAQVDPLIGILGEVRHTNT
jgi:hypothetical protein